MVAGEGLAALFESAGATVVRGGPGRRASTAELLTGLRAARARDIVVLPNDADSLAVAEAAAAKARDEGLRVAVIPTRASVQALAALAVHDLERRFEDDVVAMTAAAGHCRHGGVTVAAREAVTMAGVCRPGRRAGHRRRRLRGDRRRPGRPSRAPCSTGCSAPAASWSLW